jgi:hypothetical protein
MHRMDAVGQSISTEYMCIRWRQIERSIYPFFFFDHD